MPKRYTKYRCPASFLTFPYTNANAKANEATFLYNAAIATGWLVPQPPSHFITRKRGWAVPVCGSTDNYGRFQMHRIFSKNIGYRVVCNYADDITLHASGPSLEKVLETLEQQSSLVLEWFRSNYMKLNEDKCYMIVSGTKNEHAFIKIGQELIWESQKQSLLGVIFDRELSFKLHKKLSVMKLVKKLML